jgi:hypothetical protein
MRYWIDGDRIRFDDGVNNGSFNSEAIDYYQAYLVWVEAGNTAEEWAGM